MSIPNNNLVQLLWSGEYQKIISLVNQELKTGNETSDQLAIAGVALYHQGLQGQAQEAFLLASQKNSLTHLKPDNLLEIESIFDLTDDFLHQSLDDLGSHMSKFLIENLQNAILFCLAHKPRFAMKNYQQFCGEMTAIEYHGTHVEEIQNLESVFLHIFSQNFQTSAEIVLALETMNDLLDCIDEEEKTQIKCSLQCLKLSGMEPKVLTLSQVPLIEQSMYFLLNLPKLDQQAFLFLLGHEDLLPLVDREQFSQAYELLR